MSMKKYKMDVSDLDATMKIIHTQFPDTNNLMFMTLCMSGEAGELANIVKKIVRNGESEELWKKFEEEMVDVLIYFVKLLNIVPFDFDKAWDAKQRVLYGREGRLRGYSIANKKLKGRPQ